MKSRKLLRRLVDYFTLADYDRATAASTANVINRPSMTRQELTARSRAADCSVIRLRRACSRRLNVTR